MRHLVIIIQFYKNVNNLIKTYLSYTIDALFGVCSPDPVLLPVVT